MFEDTTGKSFAPAARRPSVQTRHVATACDPATARGLLAEMAAIPAAPGPVRPVQPLALYGAGNLGRLARDHLRAVGEKIVVVADRNADRVANQADWAGIPVLHPDEIEAGFKQRAMLAVSVVTCAYAPLEAELHADGWGCVVPFYDVAEHFRAGHPLSNGWFAEPFGSADLAGIAAALDGWSDDVSRAHHLQFLAWRRLRQEWNFDGAPVTVDDRFFIPEVLAGLGPDEVFLDGGAHHGSVTLRFLAEARQGFGSVIAIEPDAGNRAELETTLARLPAAVRTRIGVIDALLDSDVRLQPFHSGLGYASQIAASGSDTRRTGTIDGLGLAPGFVKLHLEGGELAALRGGVETLRTHRPLVAATVYHDADGVHATAGWLMANLTDHRFLFRLHSWCGTGAVVYAIPNERVPG
ncbi:FkbM family methyltransferase [Hoeflea marina]|uniref:FkbM family methyltransferase n=1 Tax=Hoeflea marina TaxID=274592 RepID=A0A317PIZ8_9HYPH|nr:FkbM family methyltransferase [Hoeflea marina]PWW00314.1 FkbM family methyltransferase [Hoeflea marina]